jgi:hypothetical protein
MRRIVLHTSARHIYRRLALALLGLCIGAVILLLQLSPQAGWGIVALSGIYALVQLRLLGDDDERVVIDDAGIRDSMLPVGVIGWDEVQGAAVQNISGVPVVALKLRDPERVIRRLSGARQFIARKALEAGLPGVYLTLVGTDGNPRIIADVINGRAASRQSPVTSR